MTIARASRLLLAFFAIVIVVWSFFDVARRTVDRWHAQHERPITLRIMYWGMTSEEEIVRQLVDRYEKENPKVHIVRIHTPGGSNELQNKLKTMLAAGEPPDLFYLQPDWLGELAKLDLIRPIDDLVAADQKAGRADWMNDIYPILLKAWHYDTKREQTGSGKLYGLPKDFTTAGFYVNVDLFNRAGVKIPYDGWTWDQFESDIAKITALSAQPDFAGRKIYGGFLNLWSDSLRNVVWTYGGDYFGKNPDGTVNFKDVTLDSPPAQEALEMIRRVRLVDHTCYNPTGIARDGGQEFQNGNIGCIGPVGRWYVPTFKEIKDFRWDFVPVPYKEKKFQASQLYYVAWCMPTACKQPAETYKLMKYLCGPEGARIPANLGLAIPPLKSIAQSPDFLSPPGMPKHNAQAFLDAIAYARIGQTPPQAEWKQILDQDIKESIQLGEKSTLQNAREIESDWLAELNSPLRQHDWKPMRWDLVLSITLAVAITLLSVLWWRAKRDRVGALDRAQARAGYLFIAPWIIGFLALTLGPMIASLLLSFTSWSAMTPVSAAKSVGIANYQQLFLADSTFYQSLKVTFYYVILAVPLSQIAALGVALLMNIKVRGITIFRTIYFVPTVVSGVALAVLWLQIFNNDYGVLNSILRPITHLFGKEPPDWFGVDARHWAVPAFVIMGLWGVGGGMIIYLAGLKGIPASLYEAARIDGAGPFTKLWNVTLPMLSPLIFFNLVMGIIGSFQIFTQAYVMTGPGPGNSTLFYVLNLYRQAFEFHNMGYASAMAWILFLLLLALTIIVFRGSKNLVYYEGLKA